MRFAVTICAALSLALPATAQESAVPRRLLFVQIADYLTLTPLTSHGANGIDRTREEAYRLATGLRIPIGKDNYQAFILTDAPPADTQLPTKGVLSKVIADFCGTTRTQDRVVLYFGVHAVAKNGAAFVVPIDADLDSPNMLFPVAEVYAHLKELKASQKVVIWDVCRVNPERALGRRDPGPMTPELFKALTAVPEGVQVLVSCSPGEHGLEYTTPRGPVGAFPGSAFLDALRQAANDDHTAHPKAPPGEEIPIAALYKAVVKSLAATAPQQKPWLAGKPVQNPGQYDPKQPYARRFGIPAMPKGGSAAEAKSIFDELAMPPVVGGDASLARYPIDAESLKTFAPDASIDDIFRNAEKYPLRIATLRAVQTIRNSWRFNTKPQLSVTMVSAPVTDRTRKTITIAQDGVALTLVELELELERLAAVADKRARETRRWQAHYDYTLAELRLRVVLLNEYNRALGHVKTEALPDLPKGGSGWRLVPTLKLEGRKDVQSMFKAADDEFTQLMTTHKGTPWEVLARRSHATLPGARWEPIAPPGK
jgi:hypothetical protein